MRRGDDQRHKLLRRTPQVEGRGNRCYGQIRAIHSLEISVRKRRCQLFGAGEREEIDGSPSTKETGVLDGA
jgi:hypothetical protein